MMRRARIAFGIVTGITILGLIVVGGTLVYRLTGGGGVPVATGTSGAAYSAAAAGTAVSAAASKCNDGLESLKYGAKKGAVKLDKWAAEGAVSAGQEQAA